MDAFFFIRTVGILTFLPMLGFIILIIAIGMKQRHIHIHYDASAIIATVPDGRRRHILAINQNGNVVVLKAVDIEMITVFSPYIEVELIRSVCFQWVRYQNIMVADNALIDEFCILDKYLSRSYRNVAFRPCLSYRQMAYAGVLPLTVKRLFMFSSVMDGSE